ncbi:hypothetical protein ABK040_015545 [Willaertia magna]
MSLRYALKALNSLKSNFKYKTLADLPPSIRYAVKLNPQYEDFFQKKLDSMGHLDIDSMNTADPLSTEVDNTNIRKTLLKPDFDLKVNLNKTEANASTYSSSKHVGTPLLRSIESQEKEMKEFMDSFKNSSNSLYFNMELFNKKENSEFSIETLLNTHEKAPNKTISADELAERVFGSNKEFKNYINQLNEYKLKNNVIEPNYDFLYNIPKELEINFMVKGECKELAQWINEQFKTILNYKKHLINFHNENKINERCYEELGLHANDVKELSSITNRTEEREYLELSLRFTDNVDFNLHLNNVKETLKRINDLNSENDKVLFNRARKLYPTLNRVVDKLEKINQLRIEFYNNNPDVQLYLLQDITMNQIQNTFNEINDLPLITNLVGNKIHGYYSTIKTHYSVNEYNELKRLILVNAKSLDKDVYGCLNKDLETFSSEANYDLRELENLENEDTKFSQKMTKNIRKGLKEGKNPFKALINYDHFVDVIQHVMNNHNSTEIKETLPFYQSKYIGDTNLPIHTLSTKMSYGFAHSGIKYPMDKVVKLTVRLSDIDFSSNVAKQNFIKIVKGDMNAKYKKRFNEHKQTVTLRAGIFETREENINYVQNLLVELIRAAESIKEPIVEVTTPVQVESTEDMEKRYEDEDKESVEFLQTWARHRKSGKTTIGADLTYGEGVKEQEVAEEEITEDYGYTSYSGDDLREIDSEIKVEEPEEVEEARGEEELDSKVSARREKKRLEKEAKQKKRAEENARRMKNQK